MRIIWIIIHGLVLAVVNLSSILIGYIVYYFSGDFEQILIQAPVAFLSSILIFLLWVIIIKRIKPDNSIPLGIISYVLIFILSLAWVPVIFYPLHFFTQHYVSSINNILWVWVFQLPTNIIIIVITYFILRQSKKI